MNRLTRIAFVCLYAAIFTPTAAAADAPARFTGPWDVAALLARPPKAEWGESKRSVSEVTYEGEPLDGKPTRVFAYFATPQNVDKLSPGMLLVHGGGGKAFRQWAELWADRGYAALAMDLSGRGPDGNRLPDGGPEQDDVSKFKDFSDAKVRDMWTYHAVAAVLRGHALLAAQPGVNPSRIGVTGISWGGYLTCIVAGIDGDLGVAVPVYGCGFLQDDSAWLPRFAAMSAGQRDRWVANLDPSRYLPGVTCPTLFVNGTNDFAYPLGSYRKSYRLVRAPRTLCVTVNMPHGHQQGWAPNEIGIFVDSVFRGGKPLAAVGPPTVSGGTLSAPLTSTVPVVSAKLHLTRDVGPWQKRGWQTRDARLTEGRVEGELPRERPVAAFLTVTDERGAVVSSEHVELPGDGP